MVVSIGTDSCRTFLFGFAGERKWFRTPGRRTGRGGYWWHPERTGSCRTFLLVGVKVTDPTGLRQTFFFQLLFFSGRGEYAPVGIAAPWLEGGLENTLVFFFRFFGLFLHSFILPILRWPVRRACPSTGTNHPSSSSTLFFRLCLVFFSNTLDV